jgi:YggT family protein
MAADRDEGLERTRDDQDRAWSDVNEPPLGETRPAAAPLRDEDVPREEARVRQIEPNRVDVDRRDGAERRLVDEPVSEERREAERREQVARERDAARERQAARSREQRSYAVTRVIMAVDYIFYLLYGLLAVRFVLALVGASPQAGFVQFINSVTQPFYAPFSGIVARPEFNGGVMDFPVLIALLAYALLHMAIRGLLKLMISPRA